uniref:Uncharacterized protein n=1 Tax=Lactuca sativa TaxID=4236 RepID=A0A9R1UGW7_LACSA|nr:hypothetical protein LSAT_V11C900463320 [Lactuca sativa]
MYNRENIDPRGKKNGHLVGTPQHKDVQKSLRADAVQKFSCWMYDAGMAFNVVKYDSLGPTIEVIARHGCGMKPLSCTYRFFFGVNISNAVHTTINLIRIIELRHNQTQKNKMLN